MKQQEFVDKVVFRKLLGVGDQPVMAVFPEEPALDVDYLCANFMHAGQPGACNPKNIVNNSRPATPEEYAALKRQLEDEGYILDVRQRITKHDADERRARLR
jgi:hypothetical protein